MKIPTGPIPLVAAGLSVATNDAVAQTPVEGLPDTSPQWLLGFIAALYMILWIWKEVIPYAKTGISGKAGFTIDDRLTLSKVHKNTSSVSNLLTHRGDDGVERFLVQHQLLRRLEQLVEKHDQSMDDFNRLVGMHTDEVRALRSQSNDILRHITEMEKRSNLSGGG